MPSVTVSPSVTRPGSVVALQGRNWPPGSFVFLTWEGLPGLTDRVVTLVPGVVDPLLNQFPLSESQIVYPRATVGTRTLHGVAPSPDVDGGSAVAFPASLLVQTPTVNPPTVGGDLALLLRNG
jgi:hypothetical protein